MRRGTFACVASLAAPPPVDDVTPILINSLKRLEYRGYDSAGIALIEGSGISTVREVGKLSRLETLLDEVTVSGRTGLGHTRWATHGRPTEVNAHPHRDSSGRIVVVHNGIIENYRALRKELGGLGHEFASETDSEVIAHLVEHYYEGDLLESVRRCVARLEGAYAIGVMHADQPDMIVAARKDSPLILGLGDGENLIASDVPAVLERTKNVVFLNDGEIAELRRDSVRVVDLDGTNVAWEPTEITWSLDQAERGGYPHFMLKEIHEQPVVVADTLLGRLTDEDGVNLGDLGLDDDLLRGIERVHLIACGTSWHSAHVGKFYLEQFARVPVDVDYASEFRYRDPVLDSKCLVIAISQSGETADTLAAMRAAAAAGCKVVGVCNVIGSAISREADGTVMTHAGPEIGVASTKAFVSQLVGLLAFSLHFGRILGRVSREDLSRVAGGLRQLPQAIETVLRQESLVEQIAKRYSRAQDFLFIGRGLNYPIALEGALKLKEISYIHAEGYPAGEMKHGPIALIDERMPLVAICTEDNVYEKVLTNVEEARVRDAKVIAIANEGDERIDEVADDIIRVPRLEPELAPIVNVVPLQLLAYFVARERGCDVDQPRNLAKSVTVE